MTEFYYSRVPYRFIPRIKQIKILLRPRLYPLFCFLLVRLAATASCALFQRASVSLLTSGDLRHIFA